MGIKKFLGFLTAVIVAVVAKVHVNIASNRDVLSDLILANVEALAGDENGNGGDGWTEEEKNNTHKENGVPVWQRIEINCYKGGPMSSCTESCQCRLYYDNQWHEWYNC